MTWRTNKIILLARNMGRRLGINKKIAVILNGRGYETHYDDGFQAELKSGQCVWDVGANVGYYTRQFATRVGIGGRVFAFEPSPANFERLTAAVRSFDQVTLVNAGLGNETGRLSFQQGTDALGATSRVVEAGGSGVITVDITTGKRLLTDRSVVAPNAIKIDVEGFELEVLLGLGNALQSPELRAIGIEVHFGILKDRRMEGAPQEIERLLESCGFEISWPDASHILARRAG